MERWLRTNEAEEAVAALEFVSRHIPLVRGDLAEWRWIIISLHIAVQGFMAVALRDSAGLTVLPDRLAAKWLRAYDEDKPLPRERLDSFPNLYAKAKSADTAKHLAATPFSPSESQDRSIERLHSFRNQFIHFVPMGWSLEVSGLPIICLDALSLVDHLAHSYRQLIWNEDEHPDRIQRALTASRESLASLAVEYGAA